jgi:hypothetical protein
VPALWQAHPVEERQVCLARKGYVQRQQDHLGDVQSMIKVESIVDCYEVDGQETPALSSKRPHIIVRSHWNRDEFVVLEVEGKKFTLLAKDIRAAIANAVNAPR